MHEKIFTSGSRRRPTMTAWLFIVLISRAAMAQSTDLLRRADDAMAPMDVQLRLRIENLKNGAVASWSELDCWNRGADKFLMVYRAPAILVGQAQLKIGDTLYLYVKKADRTTQMSAKTAFFNSLFSQEDVMSARLSALYDIAETKDGQLDGREAIILTLTGKTKDVAYGRITLYFDKKSSLPLRREYWSFSGQLIKEMTVDSVVNDAQGRTQHIQISMRDGVRKSQGSRAIIDIVSRAPIPDSYFSRSYLKVVTQ